MFITFATINKNKLAEIQAILTDVSPNLRSQDLDCKHSINAGILETDKSLLYR
ncbi:unnamed protein product, partial [Rotaria sp. Silwood2]